MNVAAIVSKADIGDVVAASNADTSLKAQALAKKCIDTVRVLGADMVEKAKSGHPGAPMGCAPIAHLLYAGENSMKYSPSNPSWANRDRFVLSNGHACALLYTMCHLTGYPITMEDLKNFRQLGSITPGHPENFLTPGVEVSTGPLGQGKLIVCYDDNLITIDGDTALTFTEDVNQRYAAYHWHVETVSDANDLTQLQAALDRARLETTRPSLIKVHGAPLGESDLKNVKRFFNFDPQQEAKAVATRNRSEEVLNAIAGQFSELMGGSADLTGSNLTSLKCSGDFQSDTPIGRYIRFGVREHAMSAICNGLFAHGLVRPFCATFLQFLGYALGAVRVSALSRFGIIYIMTHDSIGLGEDGPTHQPVEMLETLRAVPNLVTIRPCDGNEVVGAYVIAMEQTHTPTVISLSRQACPSMAPFGSSAEKVALGGYVLQDFGIENSVGSGGPLPHPTLIIIGTGTEVYLAVGAAQILCSEAAAESRSVWVRVVSMPSCELFDRQPLDYQRSVLITGAPVMSTGWKKYAHAPFGLQNTYGVSAPSDVVFRHFGFSKENIALRAKDVIAFYSSSSSSSSSNHPVAPSIVDYPRFPMIPPLH
eukprot:gene30465-39709_t